VDLIFDFFLFFCSMFKAKPHVIRDILHDIKIPKEKKHCVY
jgi:hypothetical protein